MSDPVWQLFPPCGIGRWLPTPSKTIFMLCNRCIKRRSHVGIGYKLSSTPCSDRPLHTSRSCKTSMKRFAANILKPYKLSGSASKRWQSVWIKNQRSAASESHCVRSKPLETRIESVSSSKSRTRSTSCDLNIRLRWEFSKRTTGKYKGISKTNLNGRKRSVPDFAPSLRPPNQIAHLFVHNVPNSARNVSHWNPRSYLCGQR